MCCLGCACGGAGGRRELRGSTSRCPRALPVVKSLKSSTPWVCMGGVLNTCTPAHLVMAQPASHPHMPQIHQPSLSGAGREIGDESQRPVSKTHVPDLLQGSCRWPWCSPQQRLCLRGHLAGRIHTLKKLFFQMTGLLRWFMVSDFWTYTWKDKGREGKQVKTF